MRSVVLILLSLITLTTYSQDLITLRNGEQINCKITKIDNVIIHYDFFKGERKLSSYVDKKDIRSYKINSTDSIPDSSRDVLQNPDNTVIIDTTKYVNETNKWINLVTYSQRYGLHADGWSIQYYGYNINNTSRWSIPITLSVEGFKIHPDYFYKSDYYSVNMNYLLAGISPFYKLTNTIFLNFDLNVAFGEEKLKDTYGTENSHILLGLSPAQGIYFIPKSKVGLTLGLSVYEKSFSSKVYKNDLGIKFVMGIKF